MSEMCPQPGCGRSLIEGKCPRCALLFYADQLEYVALQAKDRTRLLESAADASRVLQRDPVRRLGEVQSVVREVATELPGVMSELDLVAGVMRWAAGAWAAS